MSIEERPLPAPEAPPVRRAGGDHAPILVLKPLWPEPEQAGNRRWLVILVFLSLMGLYAWTLSRYYAGAQGGVDQAGYLMTARLIAGDKNVYSAPAPAPYQPAATTQAALDHPAPTGLQTWPVVDGVRNRLSFVPETPFQFASRMCIITEPFGPAQPGQPAQYRVYAKYPFGYPLMAAAARLVMGFAGMYVINPLCTVFACWFAFLLFRQVVSPFMSILGVIWVACNPLVLFYSNDANSHSATLLCVMMGFWGLLSWMRTRATWRAWVAGLALGYACTVRYSEFLLVLPVLFAAAMNLRWDRKRIWGSASLLIAWAIPVGALAMVCWIAFGAPWKTGYSYCNESTGFAWKYLSGDFGDGLHKQANWDTLIQQLNHTGLFVLWPLALAGLFAMMGSAWRLGVVVGLWVIPQTVLYMLYYWAPAGETQVSYLRFFMTIIPGLILAGLWVLERGLVHLRGEKRASLIGVTAFGLFTLLAAALYLYGEPLKGGWPLVGQVFASLWNLLTISWLGFLATILFLGLIAGIWIFDHQHAATKVGMALGAGVITALGCAINLDNILPRVEAAYAQCVGLHSTVDNMRHDLPRGSLLFGDDSLLDQMDCVGDWKLVDTRMFSQAMFQESKRRLEIVDKDKDQEDDPNPIQPERSRFYVELLGRQTDKGVWVAKPTSELLKYENGLIDEAFAQGRRVAFITTERELRPGRPGRVVIPERKDCDIKILGRWENQPIVLMGAPIAAQRRRMPGGRNGRPVPAPAAPDRHAGTYVVLYELVKKKPVAKTPPSAPPAQPASPVPANRRNPDRTTPRRRTIFDFHT